MVSTAVMSTPRMTTSRARPVWEVMPGRSFTCLGSVARPLDRFVSPRRSLRKPLGRNGVGWAVATLLGAFPGRGVLELFKAALGDRSLVLLVPGELGLQRELAAAEDRAHGSADTVAFLEAVSLGGERVERRDRPPRGWFSNKARTSVGSSSAPKSRPTPTMS